ncbi:MAG: hypothetical protein HY870_23485, partial [Chloroflexi bacterium]|nr:hypothetical protein [Chloroflexota bacterium]
MTPTDDLIWNTRAYVYQHFAATTLAPTVADVAAHFQLSDAETIEVFDELNNRHAFFLEPGTHAIRIANPFSAVPTDFVVQAQGRAYYANCAWDALGIAAALHSDAVINATYAEDDAPLTLTIHDGQVQQPEAVVHLLVP